MKKIYTIGHSNVGVEDLLRSIQLHRINCIIDVRSVPASSYSPQFNKEPLKNYLFIVALSISAAAILPVKLHSIRKKGKSAAVHLMSTIAQTMSMACK